MKVLVVAVALISILHNCAGEAERISTDVARKNTDEADGNTLVQVAADSKYQIVIHFIYFTCI